MPARHRTLRPSRSSRPTTTKTWHCRFRSMGTSRRTTTSSPGTASRSGMMTRMRFPTVRPIRLHWVVTTKSGSPSMPNSRRMTTNITRARPTRWHCSSSSTTTFHRPTRGRIQKTSRPRRRSTGISRQTIRPTFRTISVLAASPNGMVMTISRSSTTTTIQIPTARGTSRRLRATTTTNITRA